MSGWGSVPWPPGLPLESPTVGQPPLGSSTWLLKISPVLFKAPSRWGLSSPRSAGCPPDACPKRTDMPIETIPKDETQAASHLHADDGRRMQHRDGHYDSQGRLLWRHREQLHHEVTLSAFVPRSCFEFVLDPRRIVKGKLCAMYGPKEPELPLALPKPSVFRSVKGGLNMRRSFVCVCHVLCFFRRRADAA